MRISVTKNKDGTFSPIELMGKPGSAKNSIRSSEIFRELKAMNEEDITDSKAARLADFLEFINRAQAEGSKEVLQVINGLEANNGEQSGVTLVNPRGLAIEKQDQISR